MRTWLVTLAAVLSAAVPGFCQDISRISIAPGIVTGGLSATGTVELVAPAKNPVNIVVAVGSPAASAPRSVMVAKGQTSVTFAIATVAVTTDRIVNIEARGIASTKRTSVTIKSGTVPRVQSITFTPAGVIGGSPSTARIALSAAPQGNLTLRLASTSDLITFPATTTVPSTSTFVDVSVASKTVTEDTDVSLSAASSAGKATGSVSLYARAWATLDALTITPNLLIGGTDATLTVTLKGPAAAGGQLIRLKSSHDAATVPATLTIGAGATSAQATIRTAKVATDTDISIVAAQRSSKLTNTMTIRAEKASNRMVSFAFAPLSVIGGGSSTGTVTLENPAPTGGWKVRLLSSLPERVVVPSTITVAAGAKTATFQATTAAVTRMETVSVSASDASGRISANLEVQPATSVNRIDSITIDPTIVEGGTSATGTVTLFAVAPTGGWKVRLTSSDPRVTVPATVTVAAGNRAVTFAISTQIPDRDVLVALSGADSTARRSVQFSLVKSPPTQLNAFTLTPSIVNGGDKLTGTVTLTKVAPAGGWTVRLSASDPLLPVPSSIKVVAGKTTATFDVVSGKTPRSTDVFVSVVDGARRQTAMATILPGLPSDVELSQLAIVPTQVQGGKRAVGTVSLNKVAPAGGALIRLTSSASDMTFPKTVLVAAGSTTATFNIDTPVVSADRTVSLAATDGRKRFEATLTLVKENATVELVSVTTAEAVVPSGASTVGTVTLAAPAPSAGVRVRLAASVGTITLPKDVFVAPGTSTATFIVTTSTVREDVEASLAATYSGQKKSCALVVSAAAAVTYDLSKVVFNGPTVVGGETLTGKVILDGPAPEAGLRVRLVSDSSAFTVPKSVLVPSGAKEASFVATAEFVSATSNVVVLGAGRRTRSTTTVQMVPPVSPVLVGFEVNTLVPVGGSAQGTVSLDRPAGQRGFRVRLTSPDFESITIPREVLVPSGASKVSFDIRTELTEEVPVEIFAVAGVVQLRAESWVTTVRATVTGPRYRAGIVNSVTVSTLNYGSADVENPWLAVVTTPKMPVSTDGKNWSSMATFQPDKGVVVPNILFLGGHVVHFPSLAVSQKVIYYSVPFDIPNRSSVVFSVVRDPRSYSSQQVPVNSEQGAKAEFINRFARPNVPVEKIETIYQRIAELSSAIGTQGMLGAVAAAEGYLSKYVPSDQVKGDAYAHVVGYVLGTTIVSTVGTGKDVSTPQGSITVERSFTTSKLDRDVVGMFGRGWQTPLDVRGNITVTQTSGFGGDTLGGELVGPGAAYSHLFDNVNNPQSRFEHSMNPAMVKGIPQWKTTKSEASLELEAGAVQSHLGAAFIRYGKPVKTHDEFGNWTEHIYDGARLVQLRSSRGESLRFSYNGLGLVAKIVDDLGRETHYKYFGEIGSPSGTDPLQLESVLHPDGSKTRYSYKPGTNADGSQSWTGGMLTGVINDDRWGVFWTWNEFQPVRKWKVGPDGDAFDEYNFDVKIGAMSTAMSVNKTSKIVLIDNGVSVYSEDARGRISSTQKVGNETVQSDESGVVYRRQLTSDGNVIKTTDPLGNYRFYDGYDTNGNAAKFVDPRGVAVTQYKDFRLVDGVKFEIINHKALVSDKIDPSQQVERQFFIRESDRKIVKAISPSLNTISFGYDLYGRLTSTDFGSGWVEQLEYGQFGDVVRKTDSIRGQVNNVVDTNGRLRQTTDENGITKEYDFDALGRMVQFRTSFGYGVTYEYDLRDRLSKVSDIQGNWLESYTYDNQNKLIERIRPNGERQQVLYDAYGRNIGYRSSVNGGVLTQNYTLNKDGRVIGQTVHGSERLFQYDKLGQLVSETGSDTIRSDYQYDVVGNRVRISRSNGEADDYSVNLRNQIQSVDDLKLGYSLDGNLTNVGNLGVDWDRRGRMVRVGDTSVEYGVDGKVSIISTPSTYIRLVYEGDRVIAELDRDFRVVKSYYHGLGMICEQSLTGQQWVTADRYGSIIALTDATARVTATASYDAFGNVKQSTLHQSTVLGWKGGLAVGPFIKFGARMYSPALGRFISEDPILQEGGENFYAYAHNDPVNISDESGFCPDVPDDLLEDYTRADRECQTGNYARATAEGTMAGLKTLPWIVNSRGLGTLGDVVRHIFGSPGKEEWKKPDWFDPMSDFYGKVKDLDQSKCADVARRKVGLPKCDNPPPTPPGGGGAGGGSTGNANAVDPNDKLGPDGIGPEHWLTTLVEPLDYTIRFENVGVAAAQEVDITDALPVVLDPATVELTGISFGSVARSYGEGTYRVSDRVSLAGTRYEVLIDAAESGGNIRWFMRIVDPETGRAPIDGTGFLPRNNRSIGNGEGAVSFRVRPKASVKTGDEIANGASIRFDGGTLNTNVYKNKLDLEAPESSVDALPAETTNTDITLTWSGTDGKGSGIASYDVYVSTDGGEYIRIAEKTTNTTLTFAGQQGRRYRFFTQATDKVGKQEAAPANGFDTEVLVR